ncbi:MAG: trigger factor [Thermodesulfovibrionales bacterium]|nr:trigger factor [Thermodesulfovibrionales bacterium]
MLKSVEDINATKKRLKIEIPSDIIEKEIGNSLEKLKQNVRIPGFRPGKAPLNIIEKRYGKEVEAEALDKLIPEHLRLALQQADITPLTLPTLDEEFDFKRKNPLNISVTLEIVPKIENLTYENIAVKDIPFSVEESDLEDMTRRIREQKAVYEVADKEIEMDDFATFEHVDSVIVEGEDVPDVKGIISKMGNTIFPPDIIEKALGKKKTDLIEFTTPFDEIQSKELAGRTVKIQVRISEVKKKALPALDDEFAKDLGFENIADFREKLKEKIHAAKQDQLRRIQKAEIINKLIESHTVEVPESLLQKEIEAIEMNKNLDQKDEETEEEPIDLESDTLPPVTGAPSEEGTAVPESQDKKEDTDAALKEKAAKNVKASLLIDVIGKKEGVFVTDSEVDDRIVILAKRLSATPQAIKSFYHYKEGSLDGLKHSIFQEKVLDLLLSKATVEKTEKGE